MRLQFKKTFEVRFGSMLPDSLMKRASNSRVACRLSLPLQEGDRLAFFKLHCVSFTRFAVLAGWPVIGTTGSDAKSKMDPLGRHAPNTGAQGVQSHGFGAGTQ